MNAVEKIRKAVHPHPYPQERDDVPGTHRVFVKKLWGCPYNLAVAPWTDASAEAQLASVRKSLAKSLFMLPLFRTGGSIILWLGPEDGWRPHVDGIRPDKTGLHINIVQGLIWLDPETGVYELGQTQWGSHKFGNLSGQFTVLQETLENWTNPEHHGGQLT